MFESITFLFTGILLGLFAGISPGPLLTLIISNTLKYDKKEGVKIAFSTIIGDIPIVFFTIYFFSFITDYNWILGVISILGAGFVTYLALENFKDFSDEISLENVKPKSFQKGLITNLLSPHPYMFWILIGAPTTIKAYEVNLLSSLLFVAGFYIFLIGSKVIIAIISEKSKKILNSKSYKLVLKILGILLILFAILLLIEGLSFFKEFL